MSKKKIYHKHLIVGFFYLHGDINGGHPSLLFKKIDRKNQYFVIQFTSKPGRQRKQLKRNIDSSKDGPSYVLLTPIVSKRRHIGSKVLKRLRIKKEDKDLIRVIKQKK